MVREVDGHASRGGNGGASDGVHRVWGGGLGRVPSIIGCAYGLAVVVVYGVAFVGCKFTIHNNAVDNYVARINE
ncbi:MAG: hypothetical protein ACK559_15940 [bacterium]